MKLNKKITELGGVCEAGTTLKEHVLVLQKEGKG